MNKFICYTMVIIFAITYHFTKTTIDQDGYEIITISCNDHTALNKFYNTYLANTPINENDQLFLNIKTFQFHFITNITTSDFCYSLNLIALIQNNICIGFAEYKSNFIDIGQDKGQYFYNLNNPTIRDYNWGLIEFLYIHPQYRQQGYATILMHQLLKKFHSMHYPRAYLVVKSNNIPAINFYNKLGFFQVNTKEKTMFIPCTTTQEKLEKKEYLVFEKSVT